MPSIEALEFFNSKFGLVGIFLICIFLFIPQLPKYLDSFNYFTRVKIDKLKEALDSSELDDISKDIIREIYVNEIFCKSTGIKAPKNFRTFMHNIVEDSHSGITYEDFRKSLPCFYTHSNELHNKKLLAIQSSIYTVVGSILLLICLASSFYLITVIARMETYEIRQPEVYIALSGWLFNNGIFFFSSALCFKITNRITIAERVRNYLNSSA